MFQYLILLGITSFQFFINQPVSLHIARQQAFVTQNTPNQNGFEIVNSLPKNYVRDASADYTNLIQKAINTHSAVIFPGFPLLVNKKGLVIPSHKNLYFPKGSKLKFIDSNNTAYRILLLRNVTDVNIYNPVITVQKNKSINASNNIIGIGIAVYSSKNVVINNAVIKNCSGDGIYIGEKEKSATPQNINIVNAICDSNSRNGLTIISGINININGGVFSNSSDKLPMAGIDIEPNNSANELKNITIKNVATINNKGKGLQIGLSKFFMDSCKLTQINIYNHKDSASASAMVLSCGKTSKCGNLNNSLINIVSPIWKNNQSAAVKISNANSIASLISIKNPMIIQKNIQLNKNSTKEKLLQGSRKAVNITFDN